jgi:DNA-binding MarR family transcriptional regulator
VEKTGSRSLHQTQELVSRQGRATAGQLAEQLRLTTGAVTGLIDRMEAAGYFRRNGGPTDRRKVVIQLTPKGRERERRIYGPLGQAWAGELSAYSPEELAVIRNFLRKGRAIIDGVVARMSAPSTTRP